MPATSAIPKSQVLNVIVPTVDHERVVSLAEHEARSKSKMAAILIKEALDARENAPNKPK